MQEKEERDRRAEGLGGCKIRGPKSRLGHQTGLRVPSPSAVLAIATGSAPGAGHHKEKMSSPGIVMGDRNSRCSLLLVVLES